MRGVLSEEASMVNWIMIWLHIQRTHKIWLKRVICIALSIVILNFLCHPGRFPGSYDFIPNEDIHSHLFSAPPSKQQEICKFEGEKLHIPTVLEKLRNRNFSIDDSSMKKVWKETNCIPYKVAIVVPYRDRKDQLDIFLPYMHWFLQSQLLDYHIYVVEQSEKMDFNRALLFNIGFVEAQNRNEWPCFIFHDVDLLPENAANIYACTTCPRHMSSCVNTMRYTLMYRSLFGGVVALLSRHFELVNGFPNRYFGWGGEDDDLSLRLVNKNLVICRFSPLLSRYTMLPHKHATPNENRLDLLERGREDQDTDGLNNVASKYKLINTEVRLRYTKLLVEIL